MLIQCRCFLQEDEEEKEGDEEEEAQAPPPLVHQYYEQFYEATFGDKKDPVLHSSL